MAGNTANDVGGRAQGYKAQTVHQGYPEWEYRLLSALGAPRGYAQLEALNLWARKEGLPDDANNWLALSDPNNEFGQAGGDPKGALANGVWNYDAKGNPLVVTFPSQASGVSATVKFLSAGYGDIIAALQDPNATVDSIGQAVALHANAWGGDGNYILTESGNPAVASSIYTNGAQTGPNASKTGGGSSFTQCNSSNVILGYGGIGLGIGKVNILNPCQAKAIVGGLMVGLGVSLMVFGVVVVIRGEAAQSVISQVTKNANSVAKVFA